MLSGRTLWRPTTRQSTKSRSVGFGLRKAWVTRSSTFCCGLVPNSQSSQPEWPSIASQTFLSSSWRSNSNSGYQRRTLQAISSTRLWRLMRCHSSGSKVAHGADWLGLSTSSARTRAVTVLRNSGLRLLASGAPNPAGTRETTRNPRDCCNAHDRCEGCLEGPFARHPFLAGTTFTVIQVNTVAVAISSASRQSLRQGVGETRGTK
jgi:hypothetical protein